MTPVVEPDAYRPRLAPFKPEWEVLRSLADRALAEGHGNDSFAAMIERIEGREGEPRLLPVRLKIRGSSGV